MFSQPKTRSWKQSPKKHIKSSITAPSAHTRVTTGDVVLIKSPSEGIGVIRYINQSSEMIGIELTDPIGTTNGTFNNISYFQCRPKYGIFVIVHDIIRKVSPEELLHKVVVLNHVTRTKCQQLSIAAEDILKLQMKLQVYKESTIDLQLQITHLKKILKSREVTDVEIAVNSNEEHISLLSSNNHSVHHHNSGHSRSYSHSSYHSHSSSHNNSQRSNHSSNDRMHYNNEVSRVTKFSPEPEVEPIEYEIENEDVIRYEIDSDASPAYNPTVQQLSGFLKRIPKDQFPKLPNDLISQINDITLSPKFMKYRTNHNTRHSQRRLLLDENGIEMSDSDTEILPTYNEYSPNTAEDDEKQYRITTDVPQRLLSIDDSRTTEYITQHITHARVRNNGRRVRESLSNSRNESPIGINDDTESISTANDSNMMMLHPREENGFIDNDSKSVSPEMHSVVYLTSDEDIDDMDMGLQITVDHSHSNEHYFVQNGNVSGNHSFNSDDRTEIGRRLFTDHYKHLIDSSAMDNEVMDASFLQRGKLNTAIKQYMNVRKTHVQRMRSSSRSNVEEVAEILRKLKEKQDTQFVKRKKPGFSSNNGSGEVGSNESSTRSNSKFVFKARGGDVDDKNGLVVGMGDSNDGIPMSARDNNVHERLSLRRVSQSQNGSPRSFQAFAIQVNEETKKLMNKTKWRKTNFLEQMDLKLEAAIKKFEKRVGTSGYKQYSTALSLAHKHPQLKDHKFSHNIVRKKNMIKNNTGSQSVIYSSKPEIPFTLSTAESNKRLKSNNNNNLRLNINNNHNFSVSMDMRSKKQPLISTSMTKANTSDNTTNSSSFNSSRVQLRYSTHRSTVITNTNGSSDANTIISSDCSSDENIDACEYIAKQKTFNPCHRMSISLPNSPSTYAVDLQYTARPTFESLDLGEEDGNAVETEKLIHPYAVTQSLNDELSMDESAESSSSDADEERSIIPETPKFQSIRQRRFMREQNVKNNIKNDKIFHMHANVNEDEKQENGAVVGSQTPEKYLNVSQVNRPLSSGRRRRRIRTGKIHRYRRDRDFQRSANVENSCEMDDEMQKTIVNRVSPQYMYAVNNHMMSKSRNNNGRFR